MQKGWKGLTPVEPARIRTGFGLIEAAMVVLFIGILVAVTVPRLNLAVISKYKAEATAKKIVTDLRRVRGLAISNAATNTVGYAMAMSPPPRCWCAHLLPDKKLRHRCRIRRAYV